MGILRNARYEAVASALADGLSQEKAYIKAGYSPKGARGSAATLLKRNTSILNRRDEILAEREALRSKGVVAAAEKEQVTKEYVLRRLKTVAERCLQTYPVFNKKGEHVLCETPDGGEALAYQFDAPGANRSLELLGKEIGMFVDRKEQGPPGAFENRDELSARIKERAIKLGVVVPKLKRVA